LFVVGTLILAGEVLPPLRNASSRRGAEKLPSTPVPTQCCSPSSSRYFVRFILQASVIFRFLWPVEEPKEPMLLSTRCLGHPHEEGHQFSRWLYLHAI
jgi:hypothetical protein